MLFERQSVILQRSEHILLHANAGNDDVVTEKNPITLTKLQIGKCHLALVRDR